MKGDHKYDYSDAGFNRFYRRNLGSSADAVTLGSMPPSPTRTLNFDSQQISGALGDTLRIGTIYLDGKTGRFKIVDDAGNEVVRLGDVSDV